MKHGVADQEVLAATVTGRMLFIGGTLQYAAMAVLPTAAAVMVMLLVPCFD